MVVQLFPIRIMLQIALTMKQELWIMRSMALAQKVEKMKMVMTLPRSQ